MPSINMIAARRADKRRLEKNKQKLFYVILGEIGLALVVASCMAVKLVTASMTSTALTDQLAKLQSKVNEIQTLQNQIAALQPKVDALDEASSNTLYWYSALTNVTQSLPTSSWLTSVTTTGDAGNRTVPDPKSPAPANGPAAATLRVAGEASNQFDVGTAMLRLNMYPNVAQVKLHNISQSNNVGKAPGVNFDMEVQLKPQAPLPGAAGGNDVQKS